MQQFHYDTQPEFYEACRSTCHLALSFLNRTDGKVSQANLAIGDAFFNNGDVNKWKKFVYGILARSFQSLSSKDLYKANSYAFADSAIKYANLAMTVNADNASVKVSGGTVSNFINYWGPFRALATATVGTGIHRQGKYVADLMSGRNTAAFINVFDPRAWYMLSENKKGEFRGWYPWSGSAETPIVGIDSSNYPKNFWRNPIVTSAVGSIPDSSRYLFQNTSPWPMMTASEMQFIVAEAAYLKGQKDVALTAYKNAIKLNFDMLTTVYPQNIPVGKEITPGIRDAYLANLTIVPGNSNELTLTHIMLQKYIALFGWGSHQTWVDMRKYHYNKDLDPATTKPVYVDFVVPTGTNLASTNNSKLTYRMRPRFNSEYLYNVPELTRIGAINGDYNTVEMWFSQK